MLLDLVYGHSTMNSVENANEKGWFACYDTFRQVVQEYPIHVPCFIFFIRFHPVTYLSRKWMVNSPPFSSLIPAISSNTGKIRRFL